MSSRSPSVPRDPVFLFCIGLLGGLVGIPIGAGVGYALYSGPTDFFETNFYLWSIYGGLIGLAVGAIALPLLVLWLDRLGDKRRQAKR